MFAAESDFLEHAVKVNTSKSDTHTNARERMVSLLKKSAENRTLMEVRTDLQTQPGRFLERLSANCRSLAPDPSEQKRLAGDPGRSG